MSETDGYYIPDADWSLIPEHMHGGIYRYVMDGIRPSSFLMAVLENDLREAVQRADSINKRCLPGYVQFLWTYAPMQCSGSYGAVEEWLHIGGLNGLIGLRRDATLAEGEIGL